MQCNLCVSPHILMRRFKHISYLNRSLNIVDYLLRQFQRILIFQNLKILTQIACQHQGPWFVNINLVMDFITSILTTEFDGMWPMCQFTNI